MLNCDTKVHRDHDIFIRYFRTFHGVARVCHMRLIRVRICRRRLYSFVGR